MSDLTGKRIPKQTLHGSISTNGSSNPLRGNVMTRGLDGYSPTVEFEETEAGIKVTITDVTGPHSFIVGSGKSAYEYAVSKGYTGTEEEFADKLAADCAGNVTVDEALTLLIETGMINPATDSNGNIFTNANGDIYTIQNVKLK